MEVRNFESLNLVCEDIRAIGSEWNCGSDRTRTTIRFPKSWSSLDLGEHQIEFCTIETIEMIVHRQDLSELFHIIWGPVK